jgi:raffinose/stachyose/melibiose transport system permease protein
MSSFTSGQLARAKLAAGQQRRIKRTRALTILAFLLPGFILLAVFMLYPVGASTYYSLFKWNGLGPRETFVGLENYQRVLGHKIFLDALKHSLLLVALSLLIQLPMALGLALLLVRSTIRGKRFLRAIFFIPYVFSEVITAILWLYVYHPKNGLANMALNSVGMESTAWLADRGTVLPAIFVVLTWKFFGFHMLLYMAAIQNVPRDLEDAARVNGADEFDVLRYVTIPMMGGTIRLSVFLSILGSLQQFIIVWLLTEGGPVSSSELVVTYLMKFGITRMALGYGSAVAVLMFLLTLVFSIGYQRTIMRQDYLD